MVHDYKNGYKIETAKSTSYLPPSYPTRVLAPATQQNNNSARIYLKFEYLYNLQSTVYTMFVLSWL